MKSIFIQITSYHDYELEKTIVDAINKSSGKNNLVFGIHSIFYEDNSWTSTIKEIQNVKIIESKAPENLGMGKGRSLAHSLYNGEDFYFQIDAHSRFDTNWDVFLIEEINRFKSLGFEKPLITNYPKPYWYVGDKETIRDHEEVVTQFDWRDRERFRVFRTPMQESYKNPENNIYSNSISGGCVFVEGEFLKPNKLIFADGEEIFIAARAYTNGYDLLLPSTTFMYHLYYGSEGKNKRRLVPQDWPSETHKLEETSKEEIKLVLSGDGVVGEYRLGTKRSLSDFGIYCGLDFSTGEITRKFLK